jgi:hypothetical protein
MLKQHPPLLATQVSEDTPLMKKYTVIPFSIFTLTSIPRAILMGFAGGRGRGVCGDVGWINSSIAPQSWVRASDNSFCP